MTVIHDFYCHDFTFFNGYPEDTEVVRVAIRKTTSTPEGFMAVEGWGKDNYLLFGGDIPENTVLIAQESPC